MDKVREFHCLTTLKVNITFISFVECQSIGKSVNKSICASSIALSVNRCEWGG